MRVRRSGALLAGFIAVAALGTAVALGSSTPSFGPPQPDPNGLVDLPAGYDYTVLAESCVSDVTLTETGTTEPMPADFDGNALVSAPGGKRWLLSNHELTEPRPGDWQGDRLDCTIDEQAGTDDGDSDAWGSISRLTLDKDGVTVLDREIITTGLHNLCAVALTPWGTLLTNEEFPYGRRDLTNDPEKRSGWVWEIDPATGEATRLTGLGFMSHEQEAFAAGAWYETDDQGDWKFIYRFVPDRHDDLTTGNLYGLKFDRATGTGEWIGPLDPMDPHADMVARGINPDASAGGYGFQKAEGIVADHDLGSIVFTESGSGGNPGNVWRLTHLTASGVEGQIIVAGSNAQLSRPDNLRTSPSGDLFIYEDGGSGGDQIWVLPNGKTGADNLILFANVNPALEPTGPWFAPNGKVLYMSLQGGPEANPGLPQTSNSRVIAISGDF